MSDQNDRVAPATTTPRWRRCGACARTCCACTTTSAGSCEAHCWADVSYEPFATTFEQTRVASIIGLGRDARPLAFVLVLSRHQRLTWYGFRLFGLRRSGHIAVVLVSHGIRREHPKVFLITAVPFGAMSFTAYTSRRIFRDGSFLFMGLIGLISPRS